MADDEQQDDEFTVLSSIYDERTFIRSAEDKGGQFSAYLDLPKPFAIKIRKAHLPKSFHEDMVDKPDKNVEKPLGGAAASGENKFVIVDVNYLPPIVLNFELPKDYPSKSPPHYTLSCKWLTNVQLCELCKILDELWKDNGPGMVILFTWFQFLLEEALVVLKIESPFTPKFTKTNNKNHPVVKCVIQDVGSYQNMIATILTFNENEKERVYAATNFTCDVCLSEKPGSLCINFHDCGHIFCNQCASEYFKVQIQSGSSNALNCLASDCKSQANPSQVKPLVSQELYDKYESFLLQSTLESMSDITYCPRPNCGAIVVMETDKSMGVCPQCNYPFCVFCKKTYHGVSQCSIKNSEFKKLQEQYLSATEDEKAQLEKMYGKQKLKNVFEELVSEEWLKAHSKKCPNCNFGIEKMDGCNKMTCSRCRSHFCWLCSKILSQGNPYLHFNAPNDGCFGRLFEDIESLGDDDDDDFDDWFNL